MRRFLAVLAAALALAACGENGDTPASESKTVVRVGDATVRVDVADDEASRRRGLSGRRSLGRNDGMLFVLPNAPLEEPSGPC